MTNWFFYLINTKMFTNLTIRVLGHSPKYFVQYFVYGIIIKQPAQGLMSLTWLLCWHLWIVIIKSEHMTPSCHLLNVSKASIHLPMLLYYYRLACRKCSHARIVFTQWSKNGFFAPQGRHVYVCDTYTYAEFHVYYRGKTVGIQPPKLSKFRILAINLPLRGDSFGQFLRNSQHLYASKGSFTIFSLVAFGGQTTKL